MADSSERWVDRAFTAGESALRAWDVVNAKDEQEAIDKVKNEWAVSSGDSHPIDDTLIAGNPSLKMVGPRASMWIVSFPYANPSGGISISNPLGTPPDIDWQPGEQSEPIDRDVYNNPLFNSASDKPSTNLTESFPLLFLTVTRWERTYDVQKHFAYRNKLNKERFRIFNKWTVDAGQCLCLGYFPAGGFSLNAAYVKVSYRFEFREGEKQDDDGLWDGFKKRFLDAGRTGFSGGTGASDSAAATDGTKGRLFFANGPVTTDIPLNGLGVPINTAITVEGQAAQRNPKPLPDKVYKDSYDQATYLKYLTKHLVKMQAIFN